MSPVGEEDIWLRSSADLDQALRDRLRRSPKEVAVGLEGTLGGKPPRKSRTELLKNDQRVKSRAK